MNPRRRRVARHRRAAARERRALFGWLRANARGWGPVLARGDMYYELCRTTRCDCCAAEYDPELAVPPSEAGWVGERCPACWADYKGPRPVPCQGCPGAGRCYRRAGEVAEAFGLPLPADYAVLVCDTCGAKKCESVDEMRALARVVYAAARLAGRQVRMVFYELPSGETVRIPAEWVKR